METHCVPRRHSFLTSSAVPHDPHDPPSERGDGFSRSELQIGVKCHTQSFSRTFSVATRRKTSEKAPLVPNSYWPFAIFLELSSAMAMRRVGGLILLSKALSSCASGAGRPNWTRVYTTSLGVRGGASSNGVDGSGNATPPTSKDPFGHLPGIEVRANLLDAYKSDPFENRWSRCCLSQGCTAATQSSAAVVQ